MAPSAALWLFSLSWQHVPSYARASLSLHTFPLESSADSSVACYAPAHLEMIAAAGRCGLLLQCRFSRDLCRQMIPWPHHARRSRRGRRTNCQTPPNHRPMASMQRPKKGNGHAPHLPRRGCHRASRGLISAMAVAPVCFDARTGSSHGLLQQV